MPDEPTNTESPQGQADMPGVYRTGTLSYTKPALAILFFWLLWGDFCYTVMESVTGPIMQLKFQNLGASNFQIGLILGTIPSIVYSILNPIISFKSDRFRSRWGRRIPFIFSTLPFLVIALVSLAYSDRIGFWLHDQIKTSGYSASTVAIYTIGFFLVAFTFFNTFVTSVFWYLFNDVVPEQLLARFMSWFRIIGMGSAAFYQHYIFPYSGTHSTQIFLGAALLYLVGFGLMCLNVREGKYPPPPPYVGGGTGPISAIKTYAKGCHSHSHYWYLWTLTFIGAIGGGAATFMLFFQQKVGLTMQEIGDINAMNSVVIGVLILGSGWLADRYHPIRVVLVAAILGLLIVTPANMIWIFWHPPQHIAYLVYLAITIGLAAPTAALGGVWDPPMLMRLFPRERYGQFCSTNAVWRAVGGILGGSLTGEFLDLIGTKVGKENAYFYIPVWQFCFAIPSFILLIQLYRSWKRHGGDDAYVAPMIEDAAINIPLPTLPTMPQ